jgi:hypothetical protein
MTTEELFEQLEKEAVRVHGELSRAFLYGTCKAVARGMLNEPTERNAEAYKSALINALNELKEK